MNQSKLPNKLLLAVCACLIIGIEAARAQQIVPTSNQGLEALTLETVDLSDKGHDPLAQKR